MFTIGIASQHPPLPTSSQLSELGIAFLREALTIDPEDRPSAAELINHPWIQDARDQLTAMNEEEGEPARPTASPSSSSTGRSNAVSSLGTSSLGSMAPGMVLEEAEEEGEEEEESQEQFDQYGGSGEYQGGEEEFEEGGEGEYDHPEGYEGGDIAEEDEGPEEGA